MDYKHINVQKLARCYAEWHSIICQKQSGEGNVVSLKSGFSFSQEGYKYHILEQAAQIIDKIDWSDPNIIGSGKLIRMAMDLLGVRGFDNAQQNLVDYHDIVYFADQAFSTKCKDIEKALYLLYAENKYMEAFNLLSHLLKQKYALITYFFFLKDSNNFQVVRPKNHAVRFAMIDAPVHSATNCTWENYQLYLAVLCEVKNYLATQTSDKLTLTDTHSFIWMFWMLKSFK